MKRLGDCTNIVHEFLQWFPGCVVSGHVPWYRKKIIIIPQLFVGQYGTDVNNLVPVIIEMQFSKLWSFACDSTRLFKYFLRVFDVYHVVRTDLFRQSYMNNIFPNKC